MKLPKSYEEVLNLIRQHAHRLHRMGGGDFDELFAEANLIYVTACKTFREDGGRSFSSWIAYNLRNELMRDLATKLRRAAILTRVEVGLETIRAPKVKWDMDEFLELLSDDGLEAVAVAGEVTDDEMSNQQKRRAVVARMREMKWDRERIALAFGEVRSALLETSI